MNNWLENHGYLELVIGPMYSGKTSKLLDVYKQCKLSNIHVVVINHTIDQRYHSNLLSSHDKEMIPCLQMSSLATFMSNEISTIPPNSVILINEGQFFDDLHENVIQLVDKYNLRVYISGLDSDFKRQKFGQIHDLIPYCDVITKLHSFCSGCKNGTRAIFTTRISDEKCQVVVGSDNYAPLCRKCFIKTI